jgi:hypothetical protein
MPVNPNPPATPIKVTSGYRATGALPSADPARLVPAAYPGALPTSLGYVKDVGNMSTYKAAALDAADAARTFRATGSFEQAVVAASLLAAQAPAGGEPGSTRSYAVLSAGHDLYVTPLWMKNGGADGARAGVDVDWSDTAGANDGRGTASKSATPEFLAAVGATRWIDVRPTD